MERNKKTLQIITGIIFILVLVGLFIYVANQLQLNKDSKVIIDSNNSILGNFTNQFKDSAKVFQNVDSIKIDTTKQKELTDLLASYPAQIENSKNQLKPGINSPSSNNYKLAISKLDSISDSVNNLKSILDIKLCINSKFGDYAKVLGTITDLQDQVARSNSFSDSKTVVTNLKTAYLDLVSKSLELDKCITMDKFSDLKKSISDGQAEDKASVDNYQTTYLDPLIALYTSEDSAKISEFIDANSAVSVKLKLPSLFDNSTDLSITDKVIEEEVIALVSRI
ncbi:MAG: hypothetical protein ACMG57_05225 [Candidatus Dojkabacteria bacterium]